MSGSNKRPLLVLAYSGGLDTSVMLHWLKESYGYDIIAYCADVGQGEELHGLRERALATGACEFIVADLTECFAQTVYSAVKLQAIYEGRYLLGTALARPIIAQKQVEIAKQFGATAVAHGATGKGNDQVRFEMAFYALAPELKIIAPWRTWPFQGRGDLIAYAQEHKISVPVTQKKPYSSDRNLMHMSFEGGILEDPWAEPSDDMFILTKKIEDTPDEPEIIEISFEAGEACAINGEALTPVELIKKLNVLGGRHGVGRIDIIENRYVGIKSRGVYESPGATILLAAHRDLEAIVLRQGDVSLRDSLATRIAQLIYNGYWFSSELQSILSMVESMQKPVSGTVRIKLFKGNVIILGRRSPNKKYSQEMASFETNSDYNQQDAEGFIKLNALKVI